MRKTQPTLRMMFTCLALILAMAASGLAHTGMRPVPPPGLAAFIATGGTLAGICGMAGEESDPQGGTCDACRPVGAALPPRACHGIPLRHSVQTRVLTFVAIRLHNAQPVDPARLTRAPPLA